jgi:sodium transport system permease protein
MNALLTVFRKELLDALRDRRSWMISLAIAILSGPVVFVLIGNFVSGLESRVAEREVVIAARDRAPTLVNFLQRAGASVVDAPEQWEAQLRSGQLQNAVVVPPADFERRLAAGEIVQVEVFYDESHDKAQAVVRTAIRLVEGMNRELGVQRLIARGVAPTLLAPVTLEERNLASAQARGAQLLFVVPWVALMVSIYGALAVAIDVTAGERERGSLEPLLANPVGAGTLVLGKWAVVMSFSVVIVVLTLAGFLVSMRLISSETLQALMQIRLREALVFAVVLLPFAALMAALNMLVATFGRSFKEAQTYATYVALAAQFSALVPIFLTVRDAAWQLLVPAVGQLTVLMKALRGEPLTTLDLLAPAAVCLLLAALALRLHAWLLSREAIVFARS